MAERIPDFNYTSRDFSTIRAELEDWIQVNKPDFWNDFYDSNLGEFLIQLVAYHGDLLSFAIDRMSEEATWETMKLYKSALRHSKMISYIPRSATAASVDVKVDPLPANIGTYGVQVLKGAQAKVGDLIFEVDQDYNFPAGSSEMLMTVYEGQTITQNETANGEQFFRFTSDQPNVIDEAWTLYVNGVKWDYVDFVELEIGDTPTYSIEWNGDRSVTVRFGNGTSGRIPPAGSDIEFIYRVGGGVAGNVIAGTLNATIQGTQNGSPVSLLITNENTATGGQDRESLEHIRLWGPLNVRTVDKAITGEDYDIEATSFSDPEFGAVSRAKSKLREGTLAIPEPQPELVVDVATDNAGVESLGNVSGTFVEAVAQSFILGSAIHLKQIKMWLERTGVVGKFEIRIETDDGGAPSGDLVSPAAVEVVNETDVSLDPEWHSFMFSDVFRLESSTTYWVVLRVTTGDPGNGHYITVYGDASGGYTDGKYVYYDDGLGDWTDGTNILDSAFMVGSKNFDYVYQIENNSFGDGTSTQVLGNNGTYNNRIAQSFTVSGSLADVSRVQFYLKKFGAPGNVTVRIETDAGGEPSGTLVDPRAFVIVSGQSIYGSGYVKARLDDQQTLTAGTYWIVAELSSDPGNGHYYAPFGSAAGSYAGGLYRFHEDGGSWILGTEIKDMAFYVETGGPHVVHKDAPITFDGKNYYALSEFTIDGKNIATFVDPNTVDVYLWVETVDVEGRRTYGPPSTGLKGKLLEFLDDRAVVTTTAFIHDGENVPIDLDLGTVIVNNRYQLADVEEAILDAIEEFFMLDSIQPGTSFLISDFYDYIEEVDGVEHFVERTYFDDIAVEDTQMIVRGTITLEVDHPPLIPLKDITARY